MINFMYQCLGHRFDSPNLMGEEVELFEWYHPVYNPSGHLGLKFEKNGQSYYFSFSPKSAYGISEIPFGELRQGRPGHIMRDFNDETLLWGFRRAWNETFFHKLLDNQIVKLYEYYLGNKGQTGNQLTNSQINNIRFNLASTNSIEDQSDVSANEIVDGIKQNFKSLSDSQLYAVAKIFEFEGKTDIVNSLRIQGQPNEKTVLKTCDLDCMITKINEHSNSQPQWAPWAGSYYHQENTYNCASIMIDILYAGKMDNLTTSSATHFSYIGALLGLLSLLKTDDPLWIFASIGIGWAGGRVLGGAWDGFSNAQHFFNMNAGTKHDQIASIIGLRFVFSLMGALIGPVKIGPFFPAYLALPKNVVALAQEAKKLEDAIYLPNRHQFISSTIS